MVYKPKWHIKIIFNTCTFIVSKHDKLISSFNIGRLPSMVQRERASQEGED